MSSGTLSSSPGPTTLQQNNKRALSANSRESEDRLMKKSRTTSEEEPSLIIRESNPNPNLNAAKDKKKRHRKKKRKVSVVVIEDGRARIKDSSHYGVSQALVPSPVKLGESSRSRSESTAVIANDERDVEKFAHSPKDKGKGKAVESDDLNTTSAEQEIARLTKELAFKNELIEKHQTALTQTQQSITCQICLELMYNPYALSPCGHLACYNCLLSWFKATPEDHPNPLPSILVRKKTCPHCRAAITDRPVQVWGVKSIVSCFAKSGLLQGSFLSADEAAEASGNSAVVGEGKDPWDGIFKRRLGGVRDVTRERLYDLDLEDERGAGILDDEDGGVYRCYDCLHEIWGGLCSHCGRAYPSFDGDEDDGDFYLESDGDDDFGDDGDDVGLGWMAQAHLDFHHALGFDDEFNGDQQPPQQYEEDPREDVQRLVEMEAADEGREPDFGSVLPFFGSDDAEGHDDDDEEEEEEEEDYEGSFIDDENDVGIPARHLVALSPPLPRRSGAEIIELSSGSEDEEFPARRSRRPLSASASVRRGGRGRGRTSSSRLSPIEVSDDDEDEVREVRRPLGARGRLSREGLTTGARPIFILSDSDDDVPARRRVSRMSRDGIRARRTSQTTRDEVARRRARRNATRVESTDEEKGSEDGIDPHLALRVAAEERDLYGDDGSITRHQDHNLVDDGEDEDMSSGSEDEDDDDEGEEDSRENHDFDIGW